jgi:predicted O-methyltransferase YrrM
MEAKHVSADMPWLMPEVIQWLERIVSATSLVLETGAGGSTVFFAYRAARVITYENDPEWSRKVREELARRKIENVDFRFRPSYPTAGLELVDAPQLDLVFIDGRGRVKSVLDAVQHLKPGGWLVLDDSNRAHYGLAHDRMGELSAARIHFESGPDSTTAWRKK